MYRENYIFAETTSIYWKYWWIYQTSLI